MPGLRYYVGYLTDAQGVEHPDVFRSRDTLGPGPWGSYARVAGPFSAYDAKQLVGEDAWRAYLTRLHSTARG